MEPRGGFSKGSSATWAAESSEAYALASSTEPLKCALLWPPRCSDPTVKTAVDRSGITVTRSICSSPST